MAQSRWGDPQSVSDVVLATLTEAAAAGASDIHFRPTTAGLQVDWRMNGVLQQVAVLPLSVQQNVIGRLKVLAGLLTYQNDRPQEGRLQENFGSQNDQLAEMRLSVVPTILGEKAVVRLFGTTSRYHYFDDLGLPDDVVWLLRQSTIATGGLLLISGPAGSGKTTTAYATMREFGRPVNPSRAAAGQVGRQIQRSLVSLEDPVEAVLSEVSQSQVNRKVGFDYANGLKSLLRQGPEVILVGEIRDAETAGTAFQAALTGHLVITTFHAGSVAQAISRLFDMGLKPYQVGNGLLIVINQRLARGLCCCAKWVESPLERYGFLVPRAREPVGCSLCDGTGYAGRFVLVEVLRTTKGTLQQELRTHSTTDLLQSAAVASGMISLERRATEAIEAGTTSCLEMRRVLGFD